MKEAKHTHGPWAVDRAFGVGPISDSDDQSYGMVMAVADIYGDNRVADSRLIAAAPENLQSNSELATIVRELCAAYEHPLPEDALARSDAAIAKATGGTS